MKKKTENKLIQIVFYLNPGDYHRYHAPTDFLAKKRLHIEGMLKPVKVGYLEKYEVIIQFIIINLLNIKFILKKFVKVY